MPEPIRALKTPTISCVSFHFSTEPYHRSKRFERERWILRAEEPTRLPISRRLTKPALIPAFLIVPKSGT
jgi:hypothetical protein